MALLLRTALSLLLLLSCAEALRPSVGGRGTSSRTSSSPNPSRTTPRSAPKSAERGKTSSKRSLPLSASKAPSAGLFGFGAKPKAPAPPPLPTPPPTGLFTLFAPPPPPPPLSPQAKREKAIAARKVGIDVLKVMAQTTREKEARRSATNKMVKDVNKRPPTSPAPAAVFSMPKFEMPAVTLPELTMPPPPLPAPPPPALPPPAPVVAPSTKQPTEADADDGIGRGLRNLVATYAELVRRRHAGRSQD
eukprot:scaffold121474_cov29-Tisochrysis_lutea.AAC.1